jgi:hypothetical protein
MESLFTAPHLLHLRSHSLLSYIHTIMQERVWHAARNDLIIDVIARSLSARNERNLAPEHALCSLVEGWYTSQVAVVKYRNAGLEDGFVYQSDPTEL